jgi:hypothetical protein
MVRFMSGLTIHATFYNLKQITVVPSGKDVIDADLSKPLLKTTTVLLKQFAIALILHFYM